VATTATGEDAPTVGPATDHGVSNDAAPGATSVVLQEAGELVRFSLAAVRGVGGAPRYMSEVLRHLAGLVRGVTVFAVVMCSFIGIAAVNFAFFFLRSIGASDYIGLFTGLVGIRQASVAMFGFLFTGRVCCSMAAELGAMKVEDEVDACATMGVDPMRYLVGTRILAVILYVPIVTVACLVGVSLGTWFDSVILLDGVTSQKFFTIHWGVQTFGDQLHAFVAIFCIAVSTSIVACFYGLRADAGPASVGDVVARSLVVNLIVDTAIGAFVPVFFYGINVAVPIGG
jgi:phospholipid/cholesterol/gamma-HCH transport system permease protein